MKGKKALTLLTVSDSLVSNEETTAEEREKTFTAMMEVALEIAQVLTKFAFFDFDDTLIHGDSGGKLLKYYLKKHPLSVFKLFKKADVVQSFISD